jgi:hypothetical protein
MIFPVRVVMTIRGKAGKHEYLAGAILALLIWFATWTWPVWLWCAGTFLGAWLIHRLRLHLDTSLAERQASRDLLAAVTKDTRDALLAMCFGCFLVAAAQFVLRLTSSMVKEIAVVQCEYYLSSAQHVLAYVLSVRALALLLTGSILLSVVYPRLRPTRSLLDHKKLVSKLFVALTVATSFTFFGSATVENGQRQWIARRRTEFANAVRRIDDARRQLIAAESVKRTLSLSQPSFRNDLRAFVSKSSARPDAEIIAEGAGERLGRQAPLLQEKQRDASDRTESVVDGIIDEVRIWTEGKSASSRRLSLNDLDKLSSSADRLDAAVSESHAAVAEVIKTAAGGLVPAHADAFVRSFAKSLVGAVARHAASSVFPRNISDLRTAALWLDIAASEPPRGRPELSTPSEWRISLRSVETLDVPAEAAIAVEIQVAKAEGEDRRKHEADEREARRLEVKRANEEYRAREANRRGAESFRGESYRPAPRAAR